MFYIFCITLYSSSTLYILFQNVIKDLDVEFTYKLDYKNHVSFLYIYLSYAGLLNLPNPFPCNTSWAHISQICSVI